MFFIPNPVDSSIETAKVFENPNPKYDLFFAASPNSMRDLCGELLASRDVADIVLSGEAKRSGYKLFLNKILLMIEEMYFKK